jgi:hypothetical protein
MMASDKFEIEPEVEERKERGCAGGCLKGCFIVLLLMVAVIVVLGFLVSRNWRGWTASLADYFVQESLDASNLPAQEKQEIREELQRPLNALKAGTLTGEQLEQLGNIMIESPLLPSLAVTVVETKYFLRSGLSPEEKTAGKIALRRFVHGVLREKIDDPAIERVLSHIADRDGNEWKFRETATDDELRDMIITAEQESDRAGIPEDVEEIDPSDEIRKVIDQVMGPEDMPPAPPVNDLSPEPAPQ